MNNASKHWTDGQTKTQTEIYTHRERETRQLQGQTDWDIHAQRERDETITGTDSKTDGSDWLRRIPCSWAVLQVYQALVHAQGLYISHMDHTQTHSTHHRPHTLSTTSYPCNQLFLSKCFFSVMSLLHLVSTCTVHQAALSTFVVTESTHCVLL